MLPEVGEIIRLVEDLGRRQAVVPAGYLQRWREDGGWGATAG
jgi:hypothetical protein